MGHRVDKVAAQVQAELSAVLRELDDPRVRMATITEVDLSPDLRNARVRCSTIGGDAEHAEMMAALTRARGHIRHELAARLRNNLRRVPELSFVDDRNIEYAVHISTILEDLKEHPGGD